MAETIPPPNRDPKTAISRGELVALLAMLMATVAFSTDAMLPVLNDISDALSPEDPNRSQLVIATFMIGLGVGTLVAGPLSDAYGRRSIAVIGASIYIMGALIATVAPTLETMLGARTLQGLGAAGPRVIATALTRDIFSGRQMARIISFVMTVFALVPVMAPTLGAGIAWAFGWRAIFFSFAIFSVISVGWLLIRQPETLPPERRRPFRAKPLWDGAKEVLSHRQVMTALAIQTLVYSMLFGMLMSSQLVFDQTFGKEDTFHLWFGAIAAVSATASILNAAIVVRLGMIRVVRGGLIFVITVSLLFVLSLTVLNMPLHVTFAGFVILQTAVFLFAGLGIGNMNAIALEPMGHIAGMASSIISAVATVVSIALAVPVSLAFDGTPLPIALGILSFSTIALLLMSQLVETETN